MTATGGGQGTTRDVHGRLHIKGQSQAQAASPTPIAPDAGLSGVSNAEILTLVGMNDAPTVALPDMPQPLADELPRRVGAEDTPRGSHVKAAPAEPPAPPLVPSLEWTHFDGDREFLAPLPTDLPGVPEPTNVSVSWAAEPQGGSTWIGTEGPGWYVTYWTGDGTPLSYGGADAFGTWPHYDTPTEAQQAAAAPENLARLARAYAIRGQELADFDQELDEQRTLQK